MAILSPVGRWRQGNQGVQGQCQLHSEFKASLGYMIPCTLLPYPSPPKKKRRRREREEGEEEQEEEEEGEGEEKEEVPQEFVSHPSNTGLSPYRLLPTHFSSDLLGAHLAKSFVISYS